MIRAWRAIRGRAARFAADRRGVVTTEFMVILPFIAFFIFAYIEVGTLATRSVMLERGLDMATRDLRLGAIPEGLSAEDTHDLIKSRICANAFLLYSCQDNLLLELTAVPLGTALPATPASCVDRTSDIDPVLTIDLGDRSTAASQIMLIRACVVVDPIFPLTGIGARLQKDASGGYALVAESAFLNEPE